MSATNQVLDPDVKIPFKNLPFFKTKVGTRLGKVTFSPVLSNVVNFID
nr:MAG TPA: hypothetical protein [Caudoviricetes sp.]